MTDSTADSTDSPTEILSTTTAAYPTASQPVTQPDPDPFGPEIPVAESEQGTPKPEQVGYTPDFAALQAANAEPAVFGHEMHELIGHLTGKWIDEDSLTGWFTLLATQAQARAARELVFRVANTPVPSAINGDPALNLLDFRDEMATDLRRAVGLS